MNKYFSPTNELYAIVYADTVLSSTAKCFLAIKSVMSLNDPLMKVFPESKFPVWRVNESNYIYLK